MTDDEAEASTWGEVIPGQSAVLEEISAEVHDSPGAVAQRKWQHLDRLWYASQVNGVELLSFLSNSVALSDDKRWPPFSIEGDGPRHEARWYRELVRLLNNYVSASDALADHVIPTMREYPHETPFKPEYEKRSSAVRSDRGHFIGRLRNAALHARETLPFAISLHASRETGPSLYIGLTVGGLLGEFRRWWTAPARRYIESHEGTVDLVATIHAHLTAMIDLYRWLLPQFPQIHANDIAATDALITEYNDTLRGRGRLPRNGIERNDP